MTPPLTPSRSAASAASSRRRLPGALVALTVSGALVAGTTSACSPQEVLDCARFAVRIVGHFDAIEAARSTVSVEDDLAAYDELAKDVEELESSVDDADVGDAAQDVTEAADNAERSTREGGQPDLSPLRDAVNELDTVCVPGESE